MIKQRKNLITVIVLIALFIAGCTSVLIVGKHNDVVCDDPIGVDTQVDSVSVLDHNRTRTTIIDSLH